MKNKEDLIFGKLIKESVKDEAKSSDINTYLKKMRRKSKDAPYLDEISKIIKEVRVQRCDKKLKF